MSFKIGMVVFALVAFYTIPFGASIEEEAKQAIEKVSGMIDELDDEEFERGLEEARELFERAKTYFSEEDYQEALKAAREALEDIDRLKDSSIFRDGVKELVEKVRSTMRELADAGVDKEWLKPLEDFLKEAEEKISEEDFDEALRTAKRVLKEVTRLKTEHGLESAKEKIEAGKEAVEEAAAEAKKSFREKLAQAKELVKVLRKAITEAKEKGEDKLSPEKFKVAQDNLKSAGKSLLRGKVGEALEYAKKAERLLKEIVEEK